MINRKMVWHYRWFVLGVCFLGVNIYAVFRSPPSPAAAASAAQHFEAGTDGVVSNTIPLIWRFTTDMVREDHIGELRTQGPFLLTPHVDGAWSWETARTLRFEPDDPWSLCTAFLVAPREPLSDLSGAPVAAAASLTFSTEPLQLLHVTQASQTPGDSPTLHLEFNDIPRPEELVNHLVITQDNGEPLRFHLMPGVASPQVRIRTSHLKQGTARIRVKRGLRGESGLLGLPRDAVHEIQVVTHMALGTIRTYGQANGTSHIRVGLSLLPDASQLGKFVSVEPRVDCVIHPESRGFKLVGAFQPGTAYTLHLAAGLPAAGGQLLPKDEVRTVYIPIPSAAASIGGRGHYLSASGSRMVEITSVNTEQLKLRAERIYPNNLVQFAMRREGNYSHFYHRNHADEGISRLTGTMTIPGPGRGSQYATNRVALTSLMGDHESGAYRLTLGTDARTRDRRLVVVSDIGIATKSSTEGLLVWANSLRTLRPMSDADVRVYSRANQEIGQGRTDADGLLHIPALPEEKPFLITVESGKDINYLCLQSSSVGMPGDTGGRNYPGEGYEGYVFTDRGIYRPGETTHVHAVVRDRALTPPGTFPVLLEVVQPDGQVFRRETATLTTLGTAAFAVDWPEFAPTGRYALRLLTPGNKAVIGSTAVGVETFVPPTLAIDLHAGNQRSRGGEAMHFGISARHLFGAPATGQPVSARLIARSATFEPEGWPGYLFGDGEKEFRQQRIELGKGVLDADGNRTFNYTIPATWRPPAALNLLLAGTVSDTGGRTVSAFGSRMVDPYPYYLGIRLPSDSTAVQAKKPIAVEVAAVQPDGSIATPEGPVQITLHQVQWVSAMRERNGRWVYESSRTVTQVHKQDIVLEDGKATVSLSPDQGGQHLLTVTDPATEASSSTMLEAYHEGYASDAWSKETPDQVSLKLDRESYQAGDVARLFLQAPFPGKALVTLETDRVLSRQVVELPAASYQLEIPVLPSYQPNVYCTVTLLRPVVAEDVWAPHRAAGSIPLMVNNPGERMDITLQAPGTIRPMSRLRVDVATGQTGPVEVVLAAIDEGICRLTGFETPDPLADFRTKRRLGVIHADLYSLLLPELEAALEGTASSPGGDMMGMIRGRLNPIRARRFTPTALWSGPVLADSDGTAHIELDVPEFTGELRLMAVAIASNVFGNATAHITVKRPLVVQSSLPRFLAPDDTCSMPIRIFNETGEPVAATITLACDGPLTASPAMAELRVDTGGNQAVTVQLQADGVPGTATVQVAVQAGEESYQESFELAVRPASPRQSISGLGRVAPGETAHITLPEGWLTGTGSHQLWCSGLPTLRLAGGLEYLLRYPYGCVEQTTSTAFPLLYLADLAEQVQPGRMTRDDVTRFVDHAILRLWSMQRPNGGFVRWNGSGDLYPWASIYASHFLVEAQRAGYTVDSHRLNVALTYVKGILTGSSPHRAQSTSAWREDRTCRAYACHVLALAEQPTESWTMRLGEELHLLTESARAHLAAALALSGQRDKAGKLLPPLGPADGSPAADTQNHTLESRTREVALRLSAWLLIDPQHSEVANLARRLESRMVSGRWRTTQENAIALLAFGTYSRHLRDQQSDFTATASWANGEQTRTLTHRRPFHARPGQGPIVITNQGPGPLHYYWNSAGVPTDGSIREFDRQITVRRAFLHRDGTPIPNHRVQQGDLVIVQLEVDAQAARLDDLVIEDLLPAGLEIENPRLKSSEQMPWLKNQRRLSVRHSDARDDRMLIFSGPLSGMGSYQYATRAVTPGVYALPPVAVEGMYEPEIRSVHGQGTLEVVQ